MAVEHEVRRALAGEHGKSKTHVHGVHYERAENGGFTAHVHHHHGEGPRSEGHAHTAEHILPDMEAAQEHMNEHMGDQPDFGEATGEGQNPGEAGGAAPPEEGM